MRNVDPMEPHCRLRREMVTKPLCGSYLKTVLTCMLREENTGMNCRLPWKETMMPLEKVVQPLQR